MAVQTATNPDTGERVALVDGEWKPVVKTATNPDTGARAFLVGDQWLVNEATAKPAPKVTPKEEPVVSRETVAPSVIPELEKDKYGFSPLSELAKGFTGGVLNTIPSTVSTIGLRQNALGYQKDLNEFNTLKDIET